MHANAKFVSEGAMGYINAEEFYKEVRGGFFEDFLTARAGEKNVLPSCLAKEKTLTILDMNRKSITPDIHVTSCTAIQFGMTPKAMNLKRRMKILRPTLRPLKRIRFRGSRWKVRYTLKYPEG